MPDDKVLEVIKKYNVSITITDYSFVSEVVSIKQHSLIKKLQELSIKYKVTQDQVWVDYGFDFVWKSDNDAQMISFFNKCKTPCREIRGSRLYYCVSSRVSSESYGYDIPDEESLDFEGAFCNQEDYKKIILEFNLGYNRNGYLSMCRRCLGSFRMNTNIVPVAKQIES